MLGRLRMSIKACMDAYIKFAKEVFGTSKFEATFRGVKTFFSRKDNDLCFYRYCPKRLERAIVRCLEEQGLTAEEPLVPAGGFSGGCKVYVNSGRGHEDFTETCRDYRLVPVIELTDTKFVPRMLRTYDESDIEPENGTGWTIKAALMAATAAPTVFPTYQYEERGYVDAASYGMNNPAVESYGELQRLYLHRKEALFLDVGTGTHERLLLPSGSDFRKNASTVFKQMLSQPTDTRLPSQMVELSCNGLNGSETTYYRVDVKFPSECESIKSHHYNKIPVLGDQVAEYNKNLEARDKIEQVSRRIVDVLTGDYHRKETPWVRQARLYEPCNRVGVPGSSNGICLFK
jgi:hypothetical protein